MKIEWQAEDIKGGRRIGHPDRIEQWMIGYHDHEKLFCLVSLADGMIQPATTANKLAATLNQSGEIPVEMMSPNGRAKGGHARAAAMTSGQRSDAASHAAKARWNNAT